MNEKKFGQNTLQEYVEKERARSQLIEAVNGGTITSYFRRLLALILIGAGGGAYLWATKTATGKVFVTRVTKDPFMTKRPASIEAWQPPKETTKPAPGVGIDGGKGETDEMEEFAKIHKSQEALGNQLEAFSEGRAPAPSPSAITAAMSGEAPPPAASSPRRDTAQPAD